MVGPVLTHLVRQAALPFRAPHAMQSGENLGVEFSMEYNIKHLSLSDLAEYEAALKGAAKPAHGRVRTDGVVPMDVEVTSTPDGPEAVLDKMFHRDFAADGTYSNDKTPSPDEEPYALFIINPSFKLGGANFVYYNRYKGSHCTVRARASSSWIDAVCPHFVAEVAVCM